MKKIGIFGGSFNPVHNEHVRLATLAKEELGLSVLYIMPTFIAPHKSQIAISPEHRLNMLKLAFDGVDGIEISDYEIEKGGKSYTYQTVEHFKKTLDADLYFLVGGDMLYDFKNWKYPERILSACTLASFKRKDFSNDEEDIKKYFTKVFNKDFIQLKTCGEVNSSTKVRVYSSFNLDITSMVDKRVSDYIKKNDLYFDKYADLVSKTLPEKRVKHTANVVISALSQAKRLGLDENKVKLTATLHDIAKYVDPKTVEGFSYPDDLPAPVIHAYLGEYLARNTLNITDEEILDAIKYHTTGKANMSTLGKLIFLADMVEEDRNYKGVEIIRELFDKDIDECMKVALQEEIIHLTNKGQPIYYKTLEALDYYERKE